MVSLDIRPALQEREQHPPDELLVNIKQNEMLSFVSYMPAWTESCTAELGILTHC